MDYTLPNQTKKGNTDILGKIQNNKEQIKSEQQPKPQPHQKAPIPTQEETLSKPMQIFQEVAIREYENSILQIALANSQANCEMLIEESNRLQKVIETRRANQTAELMAEVKKIQESNKILESVVNKVMKALADKLEEAIITQTKDFVKENQVEIREFSENQIRHMQNIGLSYKQNQANFVGFQGVKHVLFWIMACSWLMWALLHLWELIRTFI